MTVNDKELVLKTVPFAKGIRISWDGFGNPKNQICIYPNGMTFNNGHFKIKYQEKAPIITYTLFISKTLTTRIEK
jgi:hypothetical protein